MRRFPFHPLPLLLTAVLALASSVTGWSTPPTPPSREAILVAARELMNSYHYCAMATLDATGAPSVRTLSPFPPEPDLTVWFATNDLSRKVQEILKHPRVALYYGSHEKAEGYVTLSGKAILVSDPAEISKRHRAYWAEAFPGNKHLVLIKVVPERLEVINYKHNLNNTTETWLAPNVDFPTK